MTTLTKTLSRVTGKKYNGRPVVVTLCPLGGQPEALISFRLLGTRTQYVLRLSDAYRMAALWYGQKEAKAKREARRNGISWARARKQFLADNTNGLL